MRKLGLWCYDKHRLVIGLWVLGIVVFMVGSGVSGGKPSNDFTLPNTEAQRALDLLQKSFPQASGDSSQIVFHVDKGTLEQHRAEIDAVVADVAKQPTVVKNGVSDPLKGTISKDKQTAFATIQHDKTQNDLDVDQLKKVVAAGQTSAAAKAAKKAGVQIALGGAPVQAVEQSEEGAPIYEIIGVVVAAIVLLVVLGSFTAMAMPLIATFTALLIGVSGITIASSAFSIADFTIQLASLIALGVGIDYGLLLISRIRNELAKGYDVRTSVGSAIDTAGRSVLFAAITVVIALCGMMVLGISFLNGPALGAGFAVAMTMFATVTLIPALLGTRLFGKRLKVGDSVNPDEESNFWARYSRFVQRHPIALLTTGLVILLVVASPVLGMRLASSDAGNGNKDDSSKQAYDLLSEGFGPGFNGPFIAAVKLPDSGDKKADLAKLQAVYKADPGVASVGEPVLNKSGDTATIQVTPNSKPQDKATETTLARIRTAVDPVEESTGVKVEVGGFTASSVDFAKVLSDKLPLFIGSIVGLSLLLLLIVFRSIVVPIKAGILNLLSILTALGVITFVFQDGHFGSLIGLEGTGPIEPFLPVLMFAVVFGLSMDYEVFLMSRMHEEWEHTKDSAYAVRHGFAMTGKVITAAALVMISVFAAFMLGGDRFIKLFGLGFASAIFFDAFVIRMMIVPSVMYLFGKRAWWIPNWLDKILPRVSIEGPEEPVPAAALAKQATKRSPKK
jgi:RND superfamily putative drug exporter